MFASDRSDNLRQGDILGEAYFISPSFHQLKASEIVLPQNTILRQAHLVVISQCCELQWYVDPNGNHRPRRPYVSVSPLSLKMPFEKGTEEYEKLVENGKNRPDNDPVQYFYFEDNPVIGAESVIDFATIMPIRSATLRDLGAKKLLQLKTEHRHLLRIRLRDYFSRIPDEDWEDVQSLFTSETI